ncbi:MAG: DNA recombination protein RmuC [Ilumatobacteraceae bacterium]|jgi:DNA recombination protein RmuC|nr:DNA recombination protein RmuC [Ilumatobacteraceae bacterium]
MDAPLVLLLVVGTAAVAALATLALVRRSPAPVADPAAVDTVDAVVESAVDRALTVALASMYERASDERDSAVRAALEAATVLQREQVAGAAHEARQAAAAEMTAKKDVIDTRLDQVRTEMTTELAQLRQLVAALSETSAQRFGQVDQSLRTHAEITQVLAESARTLREAIASPTARGQWGERMAEDVLRLAGLIENVNYVKQTQLEGATGRPDFTFPLPKGHELYMDVKFPMAAYLRMLDATSEAEQQAHRAAFLRDVRARVRELAKRDYAKAGERASVEYVLLFIPNEHLTGFIHEHDPGLIDEAMEQRVVLCSPLTLFAFLGVIRQAFDNFMIEQTSDQILALIGRFGTEWGKYTAAVDKVKQRVDQLDRAVDELAGPRRRQLEKPLKQLEAVRRERNIAIDGELFPDLDAPALDDGTDDEPVTTLRALGA